MLVTEIEIVFIAIVGDMSKDASVRAFAEYGSAALASND